MKARAVPTVPPGFLAALAAIGLVACAGTAIPLGGDGDGPSCLQACRTAVDCGTISDGCGGTLACGNTCTGGQTCGGGGSANLCGGGSGLFLGGFFPLGAYGQPPSEFADWKALGANTVQGVPSLDVAEWASTARNQGLKQIRQPIGSTGNTPPNAGNYPTDTDDGVIAWEGVMPNSTGWDEIEFSIGYGINTVNYATNSANAIRAHHTGPVFLNSGINGLGATASGWPYTGAVSYQTLFGSIDWVCNDIYPYGGCGYNDDELDCTRGGGHVITSSDVASYPVLAPIQGKGAIASVGAILDKLHAVLPTQHLFAFVEIACVVNGNPVVPPGGIRAEMWNAIIHRARGIMFFAYAGQLTHATSDGGGCAATPVANREEMHVQNALITSFSSVLQDEINPATLDVDLSAAALEAGWRDTVSGKYFFVLNTTNAAVSNATITLSGIGAATSATAYRASGGAPVQGTVTIANGGGGTGSFTDSFQPYAIHVYLVP
jgi:hypothetical protein